MGSIIGLYERHLGVHLMHPSVAARQRLNLGNGW